MSKLNWFLRLKNMATTDEVANELLNAIQNAENETAKENAKADAKLYVDSFDEPTDPEPQDDGIAQEPEPAPEASDTLETSIDPEPQDVLGERIIPEPAINTKLVERIRRRQRIAEENIAKRRNQPITLSEQKAAAIKKGQEVIRRNNEMAERRKALHEMIEKQQAERKANNVKNMAGVLDVLLNELRYNTRLEVICKNNNITRQDLELLREQNHLGWAQCLVARPTLEKEMDLFIK